MSVNVTIHRGEMRQLKSLAERTSRAPAKGLLFGLWTHSFQPVIQFITGHPRAVDDLQDYMLKNHSLVVLGHWTTNENDTNFDKKKRELRLIVKKGVKNLQIKSLFYDDETKRVEQGRLDKLPDQSAFRLFKPLTQHMRDNFFNCDVGPLEADGNEEQSDDDSDSTAEQIQVKQEQWYSTDEGMKLFGLIFNTAKQNGFEVVETSRDVDSHDIRLALRFRVRYDMRLEFPADFPKSEAIVVRNGDHKPLNVREDVAREDLAQELFQALKRLLQAEGSGHNDKGGTKGKGTRGYDTAGTGGGKGAGGPGAGGNGGGMGAGGHGTGGSGGRMGAGGHGTGGSGAGMGAGGPGAGGNGGGMGAGGHGTGGSGGRNGAGGHGTGGSGGRMGAGGHGAGGHGGRGAGEHGTGGSEGGRGAGNQVGRGVSGEGNAERSIGMSSYV